MSKQSVTLRRRVMPSGNTSLYLDIYVGGVRSYEYLHLYLSPNKKDKEANRQTMRLAEAICAKRLVEVRNGQYGFQTPVSVSLRDYVQTIIQGKKGSTRRRYDALASILQAYCKNCIMLTDITPAWFTGFMAHLDKQGYAPNTLAVYVATMRYIINQAHREGLLPTNPIANIKGIGYEETNRVYLTVGADDDGVLRHIRQIDVADDVFIREHDRPRQVATGRINVIDRGAMLDHLNDFGRWLGGR